MLLNNAYWWFTEQKQHQNLKKYFTKPIHVWDYSHRTPWRGRFLSFLYQILFWYTDLMQIYQTNLCLESPIPFQWHSFFFSCPFGPIRVLLLLINIPESSSHKLQRCIHRQGVNYMKIFTNLTGGSFSQLIQWTLQSLNILNQLGNLEIWKKRFCM